ncbi:MAG: adenylosuccinate lyase family protein, partial [Arthrobacter sp.]
MASAETADYGLLSPAWAGTRAAALTSDWALLQAMLDVELEWLRVLASAGLIKEGVPDAVAPACQADRYDIADLAARAQGGGNPVIPLLADLRAIVRKEAPAAVGPI